jgi:CheY-like chemotaxis protein
MLSKRPAILGAEDDPEMRALLDVLRNEGYDVVGAVHGAQAVLALRDGSTKSSSSSRSAWKS